MGMKANDLHNFTFKSIGYGHYRVTYTTDKRGDYWVNAITDMSLIDATKNSEWAKLRDIEHLRKCVCYGGSHYKSNGERIC